MNNKKDWLIFLILIFVQIGLLIVLGRLITQKTEVVVEARHQLKAFEQKDANLLQLQQDYDQVADELEVLNEVLPNREQTFIFISKLEKEASSSGLKAKIDFTSDSLAIENGIKGVALNLEFEGTYFDMLALLKKIEEMPQVIRIDKVAIQSPIGLAQKQSRTVLSLTLFIDPNF